LITLLVIKAEQCVSFDEVEEPFNIGGVVVADYAYILVQFFKNGTLLDLIEKCHKERRVLS